MDSEKITTRAATQERAICELGGGRNTGKAEGQLAERQEEGPDKTVA